MNDCETFADKSYCLKLIGVLASAAGKRQMKIDGPAGMILSDLIQRLLAKVNSKQFRDLLMDSATNSPLPNVIILLNERDCNLFEGLKTPLEPRTLVTIIPVAHGG